MHSPAAIPLLGLRLLALVVLVIVCRASADTRTRQHSAEASLERTDRPKEEWLSQTTPSLSVFFDPSNRVANDQRAKVLKRGASINPGTYHSSVPTNPVSVTEVLEHNVEKRDLEGQIRHHIREHPHVVNFSSCATCQRMHMDMKQASLDHIKNYVLSFLGFNDSGPPKVHGGWPTVPEYIWEAYNASQSKTVHSPGYQWEEERMNQQQQQRYMDFPTSGINDQDYMSDDPNNWNERQQQDLDSFSPISETNRIYLFANVTKFRHQQHDLLSFEFPAGMTKRKKNQANKNPLNPLLYLDVSKAILHISFCNNLGNSELIEELRDHYAREHPFRVIIHRVIAKDQQNRSSEKFSKEEVSVEVPERLLDVLFKQDRSYAGSKCRRRIQMDVSQVVKDWYKHPKRNHGMLLTTEPARLRNLISIKQSDHKPFLELSTETTRKKRVKREVSLTCKEGDMERRCCMYSLKVDFEAFGWDFIIAPKQYEANYCSGECDINFLPSFTHTHVMQMSTASPACCSPKKMQPLPLLYFSRQAHVMYTKLNNMVVESCGCS